MSDTESDDGTPTFADAVSAFTPPGTDFEEFKKAMSSQGAPGRISPEFVAMLNQGRLVPQDATQSGTTCVRCDHPHGGAPGPSCLVAEAHLGRSPLRRRPDVQLDSISGPKQPAPERPASSLPEDPMTPGVMAATAMHQAFLDLMSGGFAESQALTILAIAFAAARHEDPSDG